MATTDPKRMTRFKFDRKLPSEAILSTSSSKPPTKKQRQLHTDTTTDLSYRNFAVKNGTPWKTYIVDKWVKLDAWLAKAVHKDCPEKVFAIRTYPKEGADRVLQRYKALVHPHLVACLEVFRQDNADEHLLVVSDYLPFCLGHLAVCGRSPSDGQLASAMGQIMSALAYLHSQGVVHGVLKSSSALVTLEGVIKIGMAFVTNPPRTLSQFPQPRGPSLVIQ
ncbi:hypothetical protein BDV12DRAFT_203385 [Aspergillus spectabilis]